ncbi:MAG: aminopeptidase [Treponema berlinense]|uniref:aminopeptidase n=1 Tax=Treponema TaxID=157 RepID=UPI0023528371|nr:MULTISPECIES: aminopeptidase [Treponema]MBQ9102468.1 aminopeptidase [Treponema sp.]MCI5541686.1 aminopeptidase [Treponema berlinense]MDD5834998.1 aminopeptidase [Treponema berlinense]MDY3707880.1 aminopeptidase [Treponema berlinense]
MSDLINNYKNFLNNGKTERECAKQIIELAEKNGYKDLNSVSSVKPGDKVYIQKMNKAVALFELGTEPLEKGLNVLGAHIDSPRLDIKQNPLYEKDFVVYLNTHYYGGIKKYQWVTMPLALHGVICTKDGKTVNVCLGEDESEPVFVISDILPHLAQKQMKETASDFIPGENLDLIVGSENPVKDSKEKEAAKKNILKLLKEKYGIEEEDFGSAELEVVPAGKSRDLGLDRSLILAYGQDDRSCAFTSAQALFDSKAGKKTLCCLCVDKEEIGSVGATGMASHFFENAVAELVARTENGFSELTVRRCLANCSMLSSDVNAAYDPMNADLFDKNNASFLGGGIVFNKYTGSRGKSGASDANPEFIAALRKVLDENSVKYQMAELGKVDQGGGGTIAYLAAKYGMNVLDAGVSVLSMHAPWEITSRFDIEQAYEAYKAFLTL